WKRPRRYHCESRSDVDVLIAELNSSSELHEGVILRDNKSRWKLKTQRYLALHHLYDNGNLASPKRLVEIALSGECEEVAVYFSHLGDKLEAARYNLDILIGDIWARWKAS